MDISLEHKPKNMWEVYTGQEEQALIEDFSQGYIDFISNCKTEREVVKWVENHLQQSGLNQDKCAHFCMKKAKDKTILMARKGKNPLEQGIRIIGAHADSPRLDLKQHPVYESCDLALAKTHYYGGIRKYQWLSRPLAMHGVVVKTDGRIV